MIYPVPKPKKYKNNKYLDSLRGGICAVCKKPAEPHHVNGLLNQRAMGSKNDYLCVMLCRKHHKEAESFPKMFWIIHNIDPLKIAFQNLIDYVEGSR
jgi:hypothetical protein